MGVREVCRSPTENIAGVILPATLLSAITVMEMTRKESHSSDILIQDHEAGNHNIITNKHHHQQQESEGRAGGDGHVGRVEKTDY